MHDDILDNRLLQAAKYINCDTFLDIASDHGLLSIYASLNNLANKIIASDISDKCCKKIQANIEKYQINNIQVKQGDGFDVVKENVGQASILGVGANTIIHILDNKKVYCKQLILMAHQHVDKLRQYLYDNKIAFDEIVIKAANKTYFMQITNNQDKLIDSKYILYGPHNLQDDVFKQYIEKQIDKYSKLLLNAKSDSLKEKATKRLQIIKETYYDNK